MRVPQIAPTHAEMDAAYKVAKRMIASWPKWKQQIPATSYPRSNPHPVCEGEAK